ncbi:MAG TPA: peptidylprolyl isomerase [Balneolales bacterium]|nr:peptidylprolyl isomerase [Balneolales bacterium]
MTKNHKFVVKFSTLLVVTLLINMACSSSRKVASRPQMIKTDIVGILDNTPVTYQQLLKQYKESNPNDTVRTDTATYHNLSDFLNLYLNYRAKILEAKQSGYFQKKSLKTELNQYAEQYAYTFWMDKKIRQELLDTLIARSKWEVHASHILIALPPQAPPSDTLEAWNKLMEARRKFLNGEPFSKLINEYSTKRNGRPMGGDLGYIEAGWAIKPFEDVAFNTPVDSISMPVRTRFGYHLIYVQGRRKHQPDRLVSHIFFRTRGNGHSIQEAITRADSVYHQLQNGDSWNKLVGLSEDLNSKHQNGLIGWIDHNRFRPTFTDTIFGISQLHKPYHPFYSGYGVHIVKIDSVRSFKNRKQQDTYWLAQLKRLPRYKDNKAYTLQHIKQIGNAHIFAGNYASMATLIDKQDSLKPSDIKIPTDLGSKPVYEINNHTYTVNDFLNWLKRDSEEEQNPLLFPQFLHFQDSMAARELLPLTEKQFPQFKKDINRYMDGLVVYKITDDSVWSYAQHDTTALRKLFSSDSTKYWFPKRYEYYRLMADSNSILNAALDRIHEGVSPDSVRNEFNKQNLIVQEDIVTDLEGEPYERLKGLAAGESTVPFEFNNKQSIFYLSKILKPAPMSFDEAYNQLVTDYQPIRQKKWLENLRKKYNVQAYPDRLREKFRADKTNN